MATFLTLSRLPDRASFKQSLVQDPTLVSDFENGYQITRAKYSNVAKKFEFTLSFLTDADKILLEDFEKTVNYRASEFDWVNPADDFTYEVRFDSNLIFTEERAQNHWNVDIMIVEIRPNTNLDVS